MSFATETFGQIGGITVLLFLVACTCTLFSVGPERDRIKAEQVKIRAEAVSRGYAEWRVDPKTGETTWGWKDSK